MSYITTYLLWGLGYVYNIIEKGKSDYNCKNWRKRQQRHHMGSLNQLTTEKRQRQSRQLEVWRGYEGTSPSQRERERQKHIAASKEQLGQEGGNISRTVFLHQELGKEGKWHIAASIPPYKEQFREEGGVQTYLGIYFSIKSLVRKANDISLQVFHHIKGGRGAELAAPNFSWRFNLTVRA